MGQTSERDDYDIFISHAGPDKEQAIAICESLESHGLRCWIAPRDVYSGNSYLEEILDGVSKSKSLLLLLSSNTENAEYVINEVERAKSYRRKIFTIRLEDVEIPRSLELILSAQQWIDYWSLDYKERLQQIIHYSKHTGQPPKGITKTSLFTKLSRWITKNLLVLSILAILIFFLALFFSNRSTHPEMPKAYENIQEISQEDFRITTKYGKHSLPSSFKLTPVGSGILSNREMPYEQFYFNLEFDNETKLRKLATLMNASFNIPDNSVLPKSVLVVLEDLEGNKSEAMQFSLLGLAEEAITDNNNKTQAIISDLKKINNLQCYPFKSMDKGFSVCSPKGSIGTLKWPAVKQAVKRISYGEHQDKLINYIDIPSMKTSGDIVFNIDNYEQFRFLAPMTRETLYYQYEFVDGTKSNIGNIHLSSSHLDLAFSANANNSSATSVFFKPDLNHFGVSLVVFSDPSIKQVLMQIDRGVLTELESEHGWFYASNISNEQLSDNNYNIELRFVDEHNRQKSFTYRLPLLDLKSQQTLLGLKQDPKRVIGCTSRSCNFLWLNSKQEVIDQIDDIFIGFAADDMQSISTGNLAKLSSQAEAKREDLKSAEEKRIASSTESNSSMSWGTPVNSSSAPSLIERLSEPLVMEVKETWKQRENVRNPVILSYSFAISPIFLKLKYSDGTFSEVIVYRPELE